MNTLHPSQVAGESPCAHMPCGTRSLVGALVLSLSFGAAGPAEAADGCTVLLCLAAPSWRAIAQCVPPVRELLRDLARGKPFPTCAMAGAGNSASHDWAAARGLCPPQYTRVHEGPNGPVYTCDFSGAISVTVQGMPFSRTWWSTGGDAVTEFSPGAKAQLGIWDTRFDDDYATWLARRSSTGPQY